MDELDTVLLMPHHGDGIQPLTFLYAGGSGKVMHKLRLESCKSKRVSELADRAAAIHRRPRATQTLFSIASAMMRAAVFEKQGSIKLREVPKPKVGVGEALIRVTLTTICGTDVHILRGEYPVRAGLIVGHEPVGVVEEVGPGVVGYERGDRVIVGAITPCG